MQDQAAGGGVAPPSVSLPPPMGTRARLQTNRHTDTRRSPPFTIGLVGVALLGGGGGAVRGEAALLQRVLEASRIGQPGAVPRRAVLLGSEPLRGAWEGG